MHKSVKATTAKVRIPNPFRRFPSFCCRGKHRFARRLLSSPAVKFRKLKTTSYYRKKRILKRFAVFPSRTLYSSSSVSSAVQNCFLSFNRFYTSRAYKGPGASKQGSRLGYYARRRAMRKANKARLIKKVKSGKVSNPFFIANYFEKHCSKHPYKKKQP
jgi:hypothetical protein